MTYTYSYLLDVDGNISDTMVLRDDGVFVITDSDHESEATAAFYAWLADGNTPSDPAPRLADLVAYAAQKRWETEVRGTVWNHWPIHTDRESQGKYLSELQAIALGIREDGEFWKFADGQFRPLTNVEMQEMAVAARAHVKGSFALEAQALLALASGEATTTEDIDAIFAQEA